ncbi:MAG: TetR/AcrR family transcriptional regulator [Algoriphagus sp.]|nr:TetR/AcrR family transcriptional regulator [Algoriphagus sp.]
MKKKTNSYQLWVTLGYDLFSEEGHEGIQVERLARILGRNKSGFYHYFENTDTFFEKLIQKHHEMADEMILKIGKMESFDPEVIDIIMEYSTAILFQMQLVKNNHIPLFSKTQSDVTFKFSHSVLPLWSSYLGLEPEEALKLWLFVRGNFFSNLTSKDLRFEFIHSTFSEAKILIKKLLAEQEAY